MGRTLRPNQPGGIFHLTARTIDYERVFTPTVRTQALTAIARAAGPARVRMLAAVIMPNHLHLVVQQGRYRLSRLMQSVLRRIVHAVHRDLGREGPVFWGRYWCTPCLDPDHARNAIVYTHLNPVRARLCQEPGQYPWSSHRYHSAQAAPMTRAALRQVARLRGVVDPAALRLFASGPDRDFPGLRDDYDRYVGWRMAMDAWSRSLKRGSAAPPPPAPALVRGGLGWGGVATPLFHPPATTTSPAGRRAAVPDLADIARIVVGAAHPNLPYELIKGRNGGPVFSRLRGQVIQRAHAAGYRNADIARFLDISESAVSKVVRRGWSG